MDEAEVVERFLGRSDEAVTKAFEAHLGRRLPDDWEDGYQNLYRGRLSRQSLTLVDGILEALDGISLPTCVASSGTHDKMRHTLGLTGLRGGRG